MSKGRKLVPDARASSVTGSARRKIPAGWIAAPATIGKDARVLRVVIVDDSPRVRTEATALLERQQILVVGAAGNSDDAVAVIAAEHPDLALVDIEVGAESGFDLVRRIAAEPGLTGTRCILISTHDETDLVELIEESPALGFLRKLDLSGHALRAMASGNMRDVSQPDPNRACG